MSDATPCVSVIIPAYKAASTLARTLQSVQAQSFRDWEVVLVDDGSPDDGAAIAEGFAAADARIRVIRQENGGVSRARNRAVAESRGEILAFMDADDLWEPDKLALHVQQMRLNPALGMSWAQIRFLYPDGSPTAVISNRPVRGVGARDLLAENMACTMSNLVARRRTFDQVGGFDETLDFDEDKDWMFRVWAAGIAIEGIDRVLTGYRTSARGLASDLGHMEREWLAYVARARAIAPEAVNAAFHDAQAIFLRNLARRALRLREASREALPLFLRALRASPRGMLVEPRRSAMTGAAALIAWAAPGPLRSGFLRLLDAAPSK